MSPPMDKWFVPEGFNPFGGVAFFAVLHGQFSFYGKCTGIFYVEFAGSVTDFTASVF